MSIYNIAGLNVSCSFTYAEMRRRSEKYLSDAGTADISVDVPENVFREFADQYKDLPADEVEIILSGSDFYEKLLDFDGFMLHSSAIEVDGKAYLFSAPSGTGKSTHTEQWVKLLGDRVSYINDDKPAIRIINDVIYACGTPWSGKNDISKNVCVPLQGICMLERSAENRICRMSADEVIFELISQTLRVADEKRMGRLMELMDTVLERIPVWKLGCNISTQAAELSYKTMSSAEVR